MNRRLWCVAVAAGAACACGLSTDVEGQEEIVVLEIAPDSVPCVGEMVGRCIQVRGIGESEWRTCYSPIDGFQHEVGFRYVLEIGRREVPSPPADASSYQYRLIRVLAREPVGNGGAGGAP